MAQGREKEAVEFLQTQEQTLEGDAGTNKVSTVEVQLLLGKVNLPAPLPGASFMLELGLHHLCEPALAQGKQPQGMRDLQIMRQIICASSLRLASTHTSGHLICSGKVLGVEEFAWCLNYCACGHAYIHLGVAHCVKVPAHAGVLAVGQA